jgi:hypothetical protein
MKKAVFLFILIVSLPLLLNAWADWNSISNQHFRIYYKDKWDAEAEKTLQTLEFYRPQLENLIGNSKGRIPFTIEDIGNLANGYTDPVGTRIALFAYPPTSDELAVGEDWWQMVACHEYIHELQMTRASGYPELLRLLFGNVFYPHLWQPAWMTEGITVFGESQLSAYSGRLKGGTYPSIISALAKAGKLPSSTKASYYSFDTPHATYYTFGGAFYDYLTKTYGEGKLSTLFDLTSSSTWSYSSILMPNTYLDKAFQTVFGKTTPDLWTDWQQYESAKSYNLPTQRVTTGGWTKSDLKFYADKLYYISESSTKTGPSSSFSSYKLCSLDLSNRSSGSSRATLDDTQKPETVVEQNSDFAAGYKFANGNLYFTRLEWKRGFANSEMDGLGAVVQLWQQNLSTGHKTKLYTGQLRAFCPLSDGAIILSEDNAAHTQSTLSRLTSSSALPSTLYQADGLIFAIHEYGSRFVLGYKPPRQSNGTYLFDPAGRQLTQLVQTPYYNAPVSVEGDELVFNAVFDGQTGGYVMNLNSRAISRLTSYSDVRSPVVLQDGRIYFISVNASGYDVYRDTGSKLPYQLPAPSTKATTASNLSTARSADPIIRSGHRSSYLSNLGHLIVPRVLHVPIITSDQDTLTVDAAQTANYKIGMLLYGNDAVGDFPAWQAQVIYNTADSLSFPSNLSYSVALADNFFHPVKHVLSYEYEYAKTEAFASQQSISLRRSQNYGLSGLLAGFVFTYDKFAERKIWEPYAQADLSWAGGSLMTRHFMPYETQDWLPSDRNRLGWQSISQLHVKLPLSSEFKGQAVIAKDPDADSDEVFGSIRGYDKKFKVREGSTLQASIYKPILKIREGLWSPQIYLEDVDLGVFYDYAVPFDAKDIAVESSYGAELLLELGLAYSYRLNAGVRYSQNRDKDSMFELILGTLF